MEETSEQNKTEEATPFKLRRARERGVVARGVDLGFFSALSGLAIFAVAFGEGGMARLSDAIRRFFSTIPSIAHEPERLAGAAALAFTPAFHLVTAMAVTAFLVVAVFEIIQVRGILLSAKPLKPDFSRLDPGKGVKRLFSLRMLQETLKSIVKLVAYSITAGLVVVWAFTSFAGAIDTAPRLGAAVESASFRLLFAFALVAAFVAAIDQVLARKEFGKQMRMSRSELTREHKEREGEPRLKHRRQQLHAEFASQTRSLNGLKSSDLLIVNPEHFAVALRYDARTMSAPQVTAKGRNRFAQHLKRNAALASIAVFERPKLARALYRACKPGDEAPASAYREIADLYLQLMRGGRMEAHA